MSNKIKPPKIFNYDEYYEDNLEDLIPPITDNLFGSTIVCSGRNIVSKLIGWLSGSEWSHSAILIVGTVNKEGFFNCDLSRQHKKNRRKKDQEKIWVIESARSFFQYQGTPYDGIHLISLIEFVQRYKGNLCLQKLNKPMKAKRKMKLCKFVNEEILRAPKFERHWFQFIYALLKNQSNKVEDNSQYICSEWNANFYKNGEMLPKNISSNSYSPSDFYGKRLLKGFQLIPTHYIKKY